MTEQQEETMTVTVMYRNNWFGGDGWTYYPKQVTISAFCPACGKHRGEPSWYRFCEDGEWFTVHKWENPCGHLDTYHAVLVEAFARTAKQQELQPATSNNIENPAVQRHLLELNAQREQEDREAAEWYERMAEAQ